tara:strand:- start:1779 stop:2456 length:678 start_codon:yes stop_codon:yes gene_type:complete
MKLRYYFLIIISAIACKKEVIITPEPPLLIGPENNNSCSSETIISAGKSQVNFSWQAALNADEYELIIRDIQTNYDIQLTTFRTSSAVVLDRGNQYSWWVISKHNADQTFSKSWVWTFYLEGSQKSSHFPFPANLLNPKSNDQISLIDGKYIFRWETTDLDNDIIEYDMYLGTDPAELILTAEKLSLNYVELSLNSNQFYYWKVITKDAEGNSSSSPIKGFKTLF